LVISSSPLYIVVLMVLIDNVTTIHHCQSNSFNAYKPPIDTRAGKVSDATLLPRREIGKKVQEKIR
jgi:hypothetical protein